MKKLLFTILFCLIAVNGWGATRTISDAGGNWNATGAWVEGAVPVNGDDVVATATSGNLVVNANSANLKSFDLTGYTGTMSGSKSITVVGAASTTVDVKFAGTISWTGTLNLNPASATSCVIRLTTNTKALANVSVAGTSGGSVALQDNLTFQAAKTCTLTLSNNNLNMGAVTISGNSSINRIFVVSNTLGTARTITISGAGTFANADFRDITLSSATDLSAITGGSGDCGGNTNITFTTADDWYWNGSGTRDLSDYTYWYTATNGGGSQMGSTRSPLPQDTLYINGDSIDGATTINQDMSRIPTIDTTGAAAFTFRMNNLTNNLYGGLILSANISLSTSASYEWYFYGRGGSHILNNSSGESASKIYIYALSSTITLGGNLYTGSPGSGRSIELLNGTFDAYTYDVTTEQFKSSGSAVRGLNMGSGTWTISRATGDGWDISTTTNLTFNAETSTIVLGYATANVTFKGGGLSYNNFTTVALNATYYNVLVGSNTFNVLTVTKPGILKFTDGTTTTVSSFVATGDVSNAITLTGTSTAGWTISDTTGTNAVEYCTISYSTATGGATWNALTSAGNTDGGNNSGWDFGAGGATYYPFKKFNHGINMGVF